MHFLSNQKQRGGLCTVRYFFGLTAACLVALFAIPSTALEPPVAVGPYRQEKSTVFRPEQGLPKGPVYSVTAGPAGVAVGTQAGVLTLEGDAWVPVEGYAEGTGNLRLRNREHTRGRSRRGHRGAHRLGNTGHVHPARRRYRTAAHERKVYLRGHETGPVPAPRPRRKRGGHAVEPQRLARRRGGQRAGLLPRE